MVGMLLKKRYSSERFRSIRFTSDPMTPPRRRPGPSPGPQRGEPLGAMPFSHSPLLREYLCSSNAVRPAASLSEGAEPTRSAGGEAKR